MADNVFILGAGASKEAGAPLMDDFIHKADNLMSEGKLQNSSFSKIKKVIDNIQGINNKSKQPLYNLETLFGLIEMGIIINKFGNYSGKEIFEIKDDLKSLISDVIEHSVIFGKNKNDVIPHPFYSNFVSKISKLPSYSIITFNYDICLDFAFHYHNININYCLDNVITTGINFLKLHGSLNWGKCKKCGNIIPYHFSDYFSKQRHSLPMFENKPTILDLSKRLSEHNHCNIQLPNIPEIIPPTWNKTQYHDNQSITNVWNVAAKELESAKNIYIIGYSLPDSDLFFKYLYSLGTFGSSLIQKFCVINPDATIKDKYLEMISSTLSRYYDFHNSTFIDAIYNNII